MTAAPPTIGIIGGGQLARMMHAASIPLGVRIALLAEGPDVSAAQVVADVTVGDFTDPELVADFAGRCDLITFDHEHVPTPILRSLIERGVAVRPGPDALVHAQDKAVMRERLSGLGVPSPRYRLTRSPAELVAFGEAVGWPVIAKVSRGGYDGKGVWKLEGPDGAHEPFAALSGPVGPTEARREADSHTADVVIVAEEYIPFTRELSALVARRPGGESVVYPVSETVQRDGICHETTTPAPGLGDEREGAIFAMSRTIAHELGVVGLLAVELMERPDGEVVVNELAMRPHNTGHWTIEGALTSQFENHLRAVADLPLGPTGLRAPVVVMSNVLGGSRSDLISGMATVLTESPGARVHLYGKEVKPGRKVGHVTVYGDGVEATQRTARSVSDYLEGRR